MHAIPYDNDVLVNQGVYLYHLKCGYINQAGHCILGKSAQRLKRQLAFLQYNELNLWPQCMRGKHSNAELNIQSIFYFEFCDSPANFPMMNLKSSCSS